MSSWEPLAAHFTVKETAHATAHKARIGRFGAPVASFIFAAGIFFLSGPDAPIFSPEAHTALWGALLGASVFCSAASIRAWWRWCNLRRLKGINTASGLVQVLCVLVGIATAFFGLAFAAQLTNVYRVATARSAFSDYEIKVDVARHEVRAKGLVGPGFARKLDAALNGNAGLRTVSITSPGGLIDEALRAAEVLGRHGEVAVIARSECNSACITILMGGQKRFADYSLRLGFHAASAIVKSSPVLEAQWASLGVRNSEYVVSRGVPRSVIDRANALGPDSMNFQYAITLAQVGALQGLMDGDSLVPLKTAKWRVVESALRQRQDLSAFGSMLEVVRNTSAASVDKYADNLFASWVSEDVSQARTTTSQIVRDLIQPAMAASDPTLAMEYIKSNLEAVRYFLQLQDWKRCALYADGKGYSDINDVPKSLVDGEIVALTKVIGSAGRARWAKWPLPTWAGSTADKMLGTIVSRLTRQGIGLDTLDTNERSKCNFAFVFLDEVAKRPALEGIAAYRSVVQR